jgi:hypothetical protein
MHGNPEEEDSHLPRLTPETAGSSLAKIPLK